MCVIVACRYVSCIVWCIYMPLKRPSRSVSHPSYNQYLAVLCTKGPSVFSISLCPCQWDGTISQLTTQWCSFGPLHIKWQTTQSPTNTVNWELRDTCTLPTVRLKPPIWSYKMNELRGKKRAYEEVQHSTFVPQADILGLRRVHNCLMTSLIAEKHSNPTCIAPFSSG